MQAQRKGHTHPVTMITVDADETFQKINPQEDNKSDK